MKSTEPKTTKECPDCGNTHLVCIATQNIKICTDCNIEIPWTLDQDQKPLLG